MVPNLGRLASKIMTDHRRSGKELTQQQAMKMAWQTRDRMIFEMSAPLSPSAAAAGAGGSHRVLYGQSVGFVDYYDVTNWQIYDGGDSSVDLSGAPDEVTLYGSNDDSGQGLVVRIDFTIASQGDGIVSFDWHYSTDDEDPEYDMLQFLLNDTVTDLTYHEGPHIHNGTFSAPVKAGDVFGFRINPTDNCCGGAMATISAFSAPKIITP